jgi:hypothetical protein
MGYNSRKGMATKKVYSQISAETVPSNRRQVDEVQNIMKSNVEKVLERDGKLSTLENRAERLQVPILPSTILPILHIFVGFFTCVKFLTIL